MFQKFKCFSEELEETKNGAKRRICISACGSNGRLMSSDGSANRQLWVCLGVFLPPSGPKKVECSFKWGEIQTVCTFTIMSKQMILKYISVALWNKSLRSTKYVPFFDFNLKPFDHKLQRGTRKVKKVNEWKKAGLKRNSFNILRDELSCFLPKS